MWQLFPALTSSSSQWLRLSPFLDKATKAQKGRGVCPASVTLAEVAEQSLKLMVIYIQSAYSRHIATLPTQRGKIISKGLLTLNP